MSLQLMSIKPERNTYASVRTGCSEAIFVIFVVKNILDCAVNSQGLVLFKSKIISRRHIAASIATKSIYICIERRVAEYRRKIRARRQKIEIHPRSLVSLRHNQRELMIRNSERANHATARNVWRSLIAVCKCVRGE